MKVLEYIQAESDRQSATLKETLGMVDVWRYLSDSKTGFPVNATICHANKLITGAGMYRQMPAVFNQGTPAVHHSLIPTSMDRWNEWVRTTKSPDAHQIDLFMREFLEIHPFADGNGRIASLLYNYLHGTMFDPVPLPYYFGDN